MLKGNNLLKIIILVCIVYGSISANYAQNSLLGTKIKLNISNKSVEAVLEEIERKYSVRFSYNSSIIPQKNITLKVDNKSLGKTLTQVLGAEYSFKGTGRYIIILKESDIFNIKSNEAGIAIKGTVKEQLTGKKINKATIYELNSMTSVLSDSFGNFEIKFFPKAKNIALRCCKTGYYDSLIYKTFENSETLNFELILFPEPIQKLRILTVTGIICRIDTLSLNLTERWVSPEMRTNSQNVIDYDFRLAQLSFLPMFGTNLRMSGAVVNAFSVNLLGGFAAGVAGFEAGGILNITKKNVVGLQVSGIANFGADSVMGVQIAGLINICDSMLSGVQISPCINISKGGVNGAQIAGLLNYSSKPSFQLGLINIADTASGAPLGLLNLVKGGQYFLSFSTDELAALNLDFITGTHKLYSKIGFSYYNFVLPKAWGFSYGFGTHLWPNNKLSAGIELNSTVIAATGWFDESTISRISLTIPVSFGLSKRVYLSAGPTFNILISSISNTKTNLFLRKSDNSIFTDFSPGNTRFDGWFGGILNLRYKF